MPNENSNNDWIDNCSKGAKLFSDLFNLFISSIKNMIFIEQKIT